MPSPPACKMWISKTVRRNRQRLGGRWHVSPPRKLLSQRLASSIPEWAVSVLYLPYGCHSRAQLDLLPPNALCQKLWKLLGAPLWRKQEAATQKAAGVEVKVSLARISQSESERAAGRVCLVWIFKGLAAWTLRDLSKPQLKLFLFSLLLLLSKHLWKDASKLQVVQGWS